MTDDVSTENHILSYMNDGYYETDIHGKFTYANPALVSLLGTTQTQLLGTGFTDFSDPATTTAIQAAFNRIIETRETIQDVSYRFFDKKARPLNGLMSIRPMISRQEDGRDRVTGFSGLVKDQTGMMTLKEDPAINQAEFNRLSAREKKYRRLVETSTAGYWQLDKEDNTLDVNSALCRMLGFTKEELVGQNAVQFVDEQSKRAYQVEYENRSGSRERQYEIVFQKKNKELLYAKIDATSVFDDNGQFTGSFAVITDITDRILFQKEISRAKELAEEAFATTRTIIEKLQSGVVLINADTHVIEQVNPAAAMMFGRPAAEIVGHVCHQYLCPREKGNCPVTDLGKTVDNAERFMLNSAKEKIPILKTVGRVTMNGQAYLLESFVDITVQKKAEEKLRNETQRANDMAKAAQAASKAKSQFLANMSHEIRTPLNGVIGMAELLMESCTEDDQKHLVQTIGSEADALLGIINGILDFSKIEAGKMDIEQIPFDLRNLFEDISRSIAVRATQGQLDFLSYLDPDIPSALVGDPGRLRQVLMNLLGNALKFTRKGEIFISGNLVSQTAGKVVVRFEIKDTGIGIAKDKHELIFQSFSQADGSTTRNYGGTGLGTTISKQLVEMMGGEIGLDSEPGKGSTFWFIVGFEEQVSASQEKLTPARDLNGVQVLVIEKNPTQQYILSNYLKALGCRVSMANERDGGFDVLEKEEKGPSIDILLMDKDLPGTNGFEVARQIRQSQLFENLPVVLMADSGIAGDGQRCRDIGIDGYLSKPIRKTELHMTIAYVLGMVDQPKEQARPLVTRHSIKERKKRQIKILVAEDYPTNQQIAMRHLTSAGFDVALAENGEQAVELFKKSKFDAILMDIQMPIMDGYGATENIRKIEARVSKKLKKSCRIPVIATTAHAMKGYRDKCIQAQMDDYLTKPLKRKDLIDMVERWVFKESGNQQTSESVSKKDLEKGNDSGSMGGDSQGKSLPMDMQQALVEFDNDKEFLDEVIEEFIQAVADQLGPIRKAVKENDFTTIASQSHSIKGGAANLTAMELSCAAKDLETMGRKEQTAGLDEALKRLETAYGRLVKYVQSF